MGFFADILFPKTCFGCGRLGTYICFDCKNNLKPVSGDRCVYCKRRSFMGFTHPYCKKASGVDGVKSIFAYDFLTKKIIARIKYTLVKEAIDEYVESIPLIKREELYEFFKLVSKSCIIPVPLHSSRFAKRGFNQSEELARSLSRFYNFTLDATVVKRIKKTATQARTTSYQARVANMKDAFSVTKKPDYNTVIVFDDVWTTGSTVKEIARTLKKEGVEKVYALTMAQAY